MRLILTLVALSVLTAGSLFLAGSLRPARHYEGQSYILTIPSNVEKSTLRHKSGTEWEFYDVFSSSNGMPDIAFQSKRGDRELHALKFSNDMYRIHDPKTNTSLGVLMEK